VNLSAVYGIGMELVLFAFLHREFVLSYEMMNVGDVDMVSLLGGKHDSSSKSARDGCLLHTRPCTLSWYSDTVRPVRHKKGNTALLHPILIKEKYLQFFSLKHAYNSWISITNFNYVPIPKIAASVILVPA
jgi:hypothetical protein